MHIRTTRNGLLLRKKSFFGMTTCSFLICAIAHVNSSCGAIWRHLERNIQYYQCFIRVFERLYWGYVDLTQWVLLICLFCYSLESRFLRHLFSHFNNFEIMIDTIWWHEKKNVSFYIGFYNVFLWTCMILTRLGHPD